jgi:hypothetical protein
MCWNCWCGRLFMLKRQPAAMFRRQAALVDIGPDKL